MAILSTEGIILRKQDLRETSIILTLFTKDFGKISGVIKGVRGPRAAIGLNPQIFSQNDIVFYEGKRGNLNSISHCDLKNYFEPIRKDLERTIYGDYFIELVDKVTIEGDCDKNVYDLLYNSLLLLSGPASAKRVARIFEIKLMDIAGFMPDFNDCVNCAEEINGESRFSLALGALLCDKCFTEDRDAIKVSNGTINFIERIKDMSFELIPRVKVSQHVGRELEYFLRRFVDYHIQRKLNTVEFLKKVKM